MFKWFRVVYNRTTANIAFLPAAIALCFLVISYLMIRLDFSETGKSIKSSFHWLSLKDASTARSLITAVVSGIISLTVFSFSMVMIVLNQAASQMSNRVLDKLIGNRFQQFVLGFYIGTIVYALFLLSTIRDIDSGIYVPAISTYLLILLTIVDIFLFIYFLNYITQSVKYETIIHRISDNTLADMKKCCQPHSEPSVVISGVYSRQINAYKSGLYQGFDKDSLINLCEAEDVALSFHFSVGTFLMENTPLMTVTGKKEFSKDFEGRLETMINIYRGQEIDTSYYYGFRQLMEIAIKALSPGINDPGTAVVSVWALGELLAYRLQHHPVTTFYDKQGKLRIVTTERNFEWLFSDAMLPIWDYGKDDYLLQRELEHILTQLQKYGDQPVVNTLLDACIRHKKKSITV